MINIIGTIYDNSSQHVVAQADQILDTGYKGGTKQHLINQEVKQRLDSLDTVLDTDAEELSRKFAEINDFLDNIEETDLSGIIEAVSQETERATTEERSLQSQINVLKQSTGFVGVSQDGIKHSILTMEEYTRIPEIDQDTIYFIIEQEWTLGMQLPGTLTAEHTQLGQKLPIMLSEEPSI